MAERPGRAVRTMNVYAVVMALSGVSLVAMPALVSSSPASGVVRVMDAMLLVLAGYYRVAAVHALVPFTRASVWARVALAAFQAAAILLGWLEPQSWGGVVLDAVSAAWTASALRADARAGSRAA